MLEFFREGGAAMFVVLLFGLISFGGSIRFAVSPSEGRIGFLRAISTATVFSVLSGVASDIGAVMHKVPANPEWAHSPDLPLIVMTGLGESMAPAILGFTLLSLSWMITAVGMRRLAARIG